MTPSLPKATCWEASPYRCSSLRQPPHAASQRTYFDAPHQPMESNSRCACGCRHFRGLRQLLRRGYLPPPSPGCVPDCSPIPGRGAISSRTRPPNVNSSKSSTAATGSSTAPKAVIAVIKPSTSHLVTRRPPRLDSHWLPAPPSPSHSAPRLDLPPFCSGSRSSSHPVASLVQPAIPIICKSAAIHTKIKNKGVTSILSRTWRVRTPALCTY